LPHQPRQPWSRLYPNADPRALDLLDKMLAFNPNNRISVEDALAHPYFNSLHDPTDEPVMTTPFQFDLEGESKVSEEDLRAMLLNELRIFRPKNFLQVAQTEFERGFAELLERQHRELMEVGCDPTISENFIRNSSMDCSPLFPEPPPSDFFFGENLFRGMEEFDLDALLSVSSTTFPSNQSLE